jgi:hypothetical protein
MRPEIPDERAASRAGAQPEEAAGQESGADSRSAAEEILHDSEERVAEASQANAPADAADEHRRSEEAAGS